jgi:hypothetical protein
MQQGDEAKGDVQARRSGFLDSLGRLFRAPPDEKPVAAAAPAATSNLEALELAVRALNDRIEQQGRSAGAGARSGAAVRGATAEEAAAERARRIEAVHRAMREDIEAMHGRLGTGISSADLDATVALLTELDAMVAAGKGSHEMLPRARHAIVERVRAETGELAIARVSALLGRQGTDWPDPSRPPASATPEEIERARRRRLADLRRAFLRDDLARTSEMLQGIVKGWGADYPDRGSALWEGCVLEGVTAGVRGQLISRCVELLREDRDELLREAEAAVGRETEALQKALASGVHSLGEANRAVQSALKVLDEVLPGLAWERIRSQLPEARGDSA